MTKNRQDFDNSSPCHWHSIHFQAASCILHFQLKCCIDESHRQRPVYDFLKFPYNNTCLLQGSLHFQASFRFSVSFLYCIQDVVMAGKLVFSSLQSILILNYCSWGHLLFWLLQTCFLLILIWFRLGPGFDLEICRDPRGKVRCICLFGRAAVCTWNWLNGLRCLNLHTLALLVFVI